MAPRSGPPQAVLSSTSSTLELPLGTLRELVDHAADGVFLSEVQADGTGLVTWVNHGACELLRRSFGELIGAPLSSLLWDPDELARRPIDLARLARGSTSSVRAMRTGDGRRVIVEITSRLLEDGRVVSFTRDITDRVEAEERLVRSEASFRALIERSPDGIAVHREGRFVYTNTAPQLPPCFWVCFLPCGKNTARV